jgi:hypothetical protein
MNSHSNFNGMSINMMRNDFSNQKTSFNIGMLNSNSLKPNTRLSFNNMNNKQNMNNQNMNNQNINNQNMNNQNMNNQNMNNQNINNQNLIQNNNNIMNKRFNANSLNNNIRNNNQNNFKRNFNNNNNLNTIIELEENELNVCQQHKKKCEYYCIQCDNNYCSDCLLFFNNAVSIHQGHSILQLSQLENNPDLQNALKEYKKIPQSKKALEKYIGLCNLKLKENEIKKREIINFINSIKESYIKKLDETTNELKNISNGLIPKKEEIEYRIASIPNGFNNIINSNDYAQGTVISNELKKLNKFDGNKENEIKEKSKVNPRLFIESFESDAIEFSLPNNRQFNEGNEIYQQQLNIIQNYPSMLNIKYLANKIYISFIINISLPLNHPKYPTFYAYITFSNQNYGLEYMSLTNQNIPNSQNNSNIRQQMNLAELDAQQFFSLFGEDQKIRMKLYIVKIHYESS